MRYLFSSLTEGRDNPSHCGTAACIAGWTYTLLEKTTPAQAQLAGESWNINTPVAWFEARKALEISGSGASRLFLSEKWPKPFRKQFETATSDKKRSRIAVRRINHFIRTKGRE